MRMDSKLLIFFSVCFLPAIVHSLPENCRITEFSQVADVLGRCDDVEISNLTVPAGKTLQLDLRKGTHLNFTGRVVWEKHEWQGPLFGLSGINVTVEGSEGHLLDGQGQLYWDGKGEWGSKKPYFMRIKDVENATINNINLKNCPRHCVVVHRCKRVEFSGWDIDILDGQPGVAAPGKEGHNTDGFNIEVSDNIVIKDAKIVNQDDCVSVKVGTNITFSNLFCNGSHGLTISAGGLTDNLVENISYLDSTIINAENAIHIKTKPGQGFGHVRNVLYRNITLENITKYGIRIQQDYINGGTAKKPVGSIPISALTLENVVGTLKDGIKNVKAVQIRCGDGGCLDWEWKNVNITGAKKQSDCNYEPAGYKC